MVTFGLNHMTVAQRPAGALLSLARELGCEGIELRQDLDHPMFDGMMPEAFAARAQDHGLRVLALAEIKGFNVGTAAKLPIAGATIQAAARCGAGAVAMIPHCAHPPFERSEQRIQLRLALDLLRPLLEAEGVVGLIEPLGFTHSSLRYKADVVAVLDEMDRPACFGLIHDTFHHHLAGETEVFAELTRLVHISGVVTQSVETDALVDVHRGLVGPQDRLQSVGQLHELYNTGFAGVASHEAFAPEVHALADPASALMASQDYIISQLK